MAKKSKKKLQGNKAMMRAFLELRRSSAAMPISSKKKYRRSRDKYNPNSNKNENLNPNNNNDES